MRLIIGIGLLQSPCFQRLLVLDLVDGIAKWHLVECSNKRVFSRCWTITQLFFCGGKRTKTLDSPKVIVFTLGYCGRLKSCDLCRAASIDKSLLPWTSVRHRISLAFSYWRFRSENILSLGDLNRGSKPLTIFISWDRCGSVVTVNWLWPYLFYTANEVGWAKPSLTSCEYILVAKKV